MRITHTWRLASALFLCGGLFATNQFVGTGNSVAHAAGTATSTQLTQFRTTNFPIGGIINVGRPGLAPSDIDGGDDGGSHTVPINVNRTLGVSKGQGRMGVGAAGTAKSNPSLVQSFDGLNNFDEASAAPGGNLIFEPPDQALCAGNGYVVDGVNDAMSVYNQSTHTRVAGPTTLNAFLGFAPELDSNGVFGPETTDPSCYYDSSTGRFFFSILTLNLNPDGSWDGSNEEDIAVSNSSDPTGSWNVYRMNVTLDGSGCAFSESDFNPCLGDYPHIGADANGVYLTTNDFPLVANGFYGSQIYAFSKAALESGTATVNGWRFDTSDPSNTVAGDAGYSLTPSTAPGGKFETAANGTEYFLSTTFDNCAACTTSDNRVAVWALTNTRNLSGSNPPALTNTTVTISPYGDPPQATQKNGVTPFNTLAYGATSPGLIATNDAGNHNAVFANGKLWGAFTTGVTENGTKEAGIAYYIVTPNVTPKGVLSASLALQGTLAASNANLIFPTIGVTPSGRGVMAYTLTGPNDFPSAAYSSIDAKSGAGPITTAAAGAGPSDGFTENQPYYSDGSPRPRWGDYGAASVDGNNVWVASEYIGQTCDIPTYLSDYPNDTCGNTRTYAANWDTRITELNMSTSSSGS